MKVDIEIQSMEIKQDLKKTTSKLKVKKVIHPDHAIMTRAKLIHAHCCKGLS